MLSLTIVNSLPPVLWPKNKYVKVNNKCKTKTFHWNWIHFNKKKKCK
jgi:hypothetical protein